MKKNEVFECEITGYSSEGQGLCRIEGVVVFVRGGVRGDVCLARIVKVASSHAYAIIERLIKPSPHHTQQECEYFPKCGGCVFWQMTYEEELYYKTRRVYDALSRIGGVEIIAEEVFAAPSVYSYRNKCQYPVRMVNGAVKTGFFREHSHDLIPIERCLIGKDEANFLCGAVRAHMERYDILPYDEESGKGLVRTIYTRVASDGGVLLTLVLNGRQIPKSAELIDACLAVCPALRGIVINVNTLRANTLLGEEILPLWGESKLREELCGLHFELSPLSFFQINHAQCQRLYDRAIEYACMLGGTRALDLYCGTGTISLCLAREFETVTGIEVVPAAIADARKNAALNGMNNVSFICADAEDAANMLRKNGELPDVVVVDPPRKGLSPKTVDIIAGMQPRGVIYVSCDPATLARDIARFGAHGYVLKRLTIADMFPRTGHVECVVLITRVEK